MTADRRLEAEERFATIPEVLPEHRWHDGWDGAASVEDRQHSEDGMYMPYPHQWDQTMRFCRIRASIHYHRSLNPWVDDPESIPIPGWVVRRALPYLPNRYEDDRRYERPH